jgi:hypothetical protein
MKVFGIGLGRTGTTSLTRALEILGYRAKHCPRFYLDANRELCVSPDQIAHYDALTDEPIALIYRTLDRQYPGSRFILTVREMGSWLTSRENNSRAMGKWWAKNPAVPVLHAALFGAPTFECTTYAWAHRRYVADVYTYFAERPHDLLVMDICDGEGWEKLCPFLNKPMPEVDFPRRNVFIETDYARNLHSLNERSMEQISYLDGQDARDPSGEP